MRKENTIIIGIAAVVIVACLLVSWVYIDDGDTGDLAVRSEASVGDFAELHVTVYGDSPSEYDVRYNVVSIENGETTIEVVREDGVTEYIASDLVIEYPEGKSVGTGILTLDRFGDVECEIYQRRRILAVPPDHGQLPLRSRTACVRIPGVVLRTRGWGLLRGPPDPYIP